MITPSTSNPTTAPTIAPTLDFFSAGSSVPIDLLEPGIGEGEGEGGGEGNIELGSFELFVSGVGEAGLVASTGISVVDVAVAVVVVDVVVVGGVEVVEVVVVRVSEVVMAVTVQTVQCSLSGWFCVVLVAHGDSTKHHVGG
jgi:hypothetical protein